MIKLANDKDFTGSLGKVKKENVIHLSFVIRDINQWTLL